jgi:hypothetical protein
MDNYLVGGLGEWRAMFYLASTWSYVPSGTDKKQVGNFPLQVGDLPRGVGKKIDLETVVFAQEKHLFYKISQNRYAKEQPRTKKASHRLLRICVSVYRADKNTALNHKSGRTTHNFCKNGVTTIF